MPRVVPLLLALLAAGAAPALADDEAARLRGSPASMIRQHQVAKANDFTFLRTSAQVREFVDKGYLVEVESNADLEVLRSVSYPVGRPELKLFLERLAAQHRDACGERLVVTSMTRPSSAQPANSHRLSVHPAGMAVDLRVLSDGRCRSWLEGTLLSLERRGLLDVTRERRPPHYHVALFTNAYREYVAPLLAADSARAEEARIAREEAERREALAKLASAAPALVPAVEEPVDEARAANLWLVAAVPLVLLPLVLGAARRRLAARRR